MRTSPSKAHGSFCQTSKPSECKLTLGADDARSQASTDINSEMTDIDTFSVISDLTCKYYTIKDGVFYDLQGKAQSAKWAKRMRQKESKETAGSSGATGAVKGTMAIAVPESNPVAPEAVGASKAGINRPKGMPEAPAAGRIIATWPIVECATVECHVQNRWNRMYEHHEIIKPGGSGKWGDDDDPEEIVFYWCAVCMAKLWECTPQVAQARIIGERPGFVKKRAKNEAFKIADAKVAQALPALSKSDRRLIATRITVEDMQEVVAPLSKFIQL